MRPTLHADCLVQVFKARNEPSQLIPISSYSPDFFLENTFDRMFSVQGSLLMERREDDLYRISVGEHSLSGSEDLLVAGLFDDKAPCSRIPKPFISVSVNLSDIASRRRFSVRLHEDDKSITDRHLKSLFPLRAGSRHDRWKSYYFIWEIEELLDEVHKRTQLLPVVAGIDNVRVPDDVREGTELPRSTFIPVIALSHSFEFSPSTPQYIVTAKGLGSPLLSQVTDCEIEHGIFDFYFPRGEPDEPRSKNPSRACFTANGFPVFHEIAGCDPHEFARQHDYASRGV